MWRYRLAGLLVGVAGVVLLTSLTYALYAGVDLGPFAVVRMGMPLVLLAAATGQLLVAVGVWLAAFHHPSQWRLRP